jgi:hypothetical protein
VVDRQAQSIDLQQIKIYAEIDRGASILVRIARRSAGRRAACEVNGACGERTTRIAVSGSNLGSASQGATRPGVLTGWRAFADACYGPEE